MNTENFQSLYDKQRVLYIQEKYRFKREELGFLRACSGPGIVLRLQYLPPVE